MAPPPPLIAFRLFRFIRWMPPSLPPGLRAQRSTASPLRPIATEVADQLLVTQEHEGCIRFMWKGEVPEGYRTGAHVEVAMDIPGNPGASDVWIIEESIAPEAVPA